MTGMPCAEQGPAMVEAWLSLNAMIGLVVGLRYSSGPLIEYHLDLIETLYPDRCSLSTTHHGKFTCRGESERDSAIEVSLLVPTAEVLSAVRDGSAWGRGRPLPLLSATDLDQELLPLAEAQYAVLNCGPTAARAG